jgi:fatty acid amide hydrolase 2
MKFQVTCTQVLTDFIQYSKEMNRILNAIVADCYDDAMKQAAEVDKMLSDGRVVTAEEFPFLGVPFTAKEAFAAKGCALIFHFIMLHCLDFFISRDA